MDPGTLAIIGTGLQIFGQISGSQKAADQARAEGAAAQQAAVYNAAIARENAELARVDAGIVADQGAATLEQFVRQAAAIEGKVIASYGASGVVSSEGSPLEIMAQSAGQAAYDAQMIQYKTALGVRSKLQQASLYDRDASFALQGGAAAASRASSKADDLEMAGWLNAGSTLFGAATQYGWIGGGSTSTGGNAGTGFVAPSSPNLSYMGGGQGVRGSVQW